MEPRKHPPRAIPFTAAPPDSNLLRRVRGEFEEMPDMRLSLDQATRLWSIDRNDCKRILETLTKSHFLEIDARGRYRKSHSGY